MIARIKRLALVHSYRIRRVRAWLNRNFVLVLLISVAFFAYQNAGFQKDNRQLLSDTHATTKNTERIIEKQDETITALEKAVVRLENGDKEKTDLIICLLAIHGESTAVTKTDEEFCRVLVEEAQEDPSFNPRPQPQTQHQKQSFLDEGESPRSPGRQDPPENPEQPEQPGLLGQIGQSVNENVLRPTDDFINDVWNVIFGGNR